MGFIIRRFYGLYFPAFGQNTEIYGVNLRIKSKCGKMPEMKMTLFQRT